MVSDIIWTPKRHKIGPLVSIIGLEPWQKTDKKNQNFVQSFMAFSITVTFILPSMGHLPSPHIGLHILCIAFTGNKAYFENYVKMSKVG